MKIRFKFPNIDIVYYFLFAIAVIPLLAPYYFLQHEAIGSLIDYWMYLSILILSVYVVSHYRRISAPIIIILVMYALLLCVTISNHGEVIAVIKHSIKVIVLCCLIDVLKDDSKKMSTLLHVVRDITIILFFANFMACIIWNKGIPSITQNSLYPYHLFGNINTTIRVVLPGMLCSTLINHKNNKKHNLFSFIYLIGFIYIYLRIYPTTTTLIAILIITIWILFENVFMKLSSQIYFVSICAILILELLIVVLSDTNIIGFIASVFNKSTDFTGRAYLWSRAMRSIREHPVLGIGRQTLSDIRISIGNISGSHNYFLDILYQRGVAGLVLFLILVLRPIVKMKKDNSKKGAIIYVLIGYCMCLLTMFLSEPFFEYEYYFIPIFYALHIYVCTHPRFKEGLSYET